MVDLPTYEALRAVEAPVLNGLVAEAAGRVAGPYDYAWQRQRDLWAAVTGALTVAASGRRPAAARDAPPAYLGVLVRERLAQYSRNWPQTGGFAGLRLLERLGLVRAEHDDTYVLAFVGALGDRWGKISRASAVRADLGLLDVLWRVFEVEGGGEISLANIDKFSMPEGTWRTTFLDLLSDGTIERDRVLTRCLDALGSDFSAYRAGWYSGLYAALEPTIAEDTARQERLRSLLRSQVGATVSLAARRLRGISAAGLLDDDAVADLAPGLAARAKGPADDLLKVLRDVTRRRVDLRGLVAEVAATALGHSDSSVDVAEPLAPVPATAARVVVPVQDRDVLERLAVVLEDAGDALEQELCIAGLASLGEPARLRPLARRSPGPVAPAG